MPRLALESLHYSGSTCVDAKRYSIDGCVKAGRHVVAFDGWEAEVCIEENSAPVRSLHVVFRRTGPSLDAAAVAVSFEFLATPSTRPAVFLPGAVYAGNRFDVRSLPYSPRLSEEDASPSVPTLITDVPRLAQTGPSRLQLRLGDLACPAVGFFFPEPGAGWWWLAEPRSRDLGFDVAEDLSTGLTRVRIALPGVREGTRYRHGTTHHPSVDTGAAITTGDHVVIALQIREQTSCELPAFLDAFLSFRESVGSFRAPAEFPFSSAFSVVEEHYNRDNWLETAGLYATDSNPAAVYPFQTGWCGGGIASWALLHSNHERTRARARLTLDRLFTRGVSPSGFFWGKAFADGTWGSDFCRDHERPWLHDRTLIRRQADALHYGLKAVAHLGGEAPETWRAALRGCADAFVRLWRNEGQFGQFVSQATGAVLIGNSTSAALAPAALARASVEFNRATYLDVAEASARDFCARFLLKGYTTGGPADALQNPDSESCAALLESCMELHAITHCDEWLRMAGLAAALLSTWVMSYDFDFPTGTEAARLGWRTKGTVFANIQNKHSSPGICTGSGIGLLRLFRAGRDPRHLDLLRDVARALPQFVSRVDRLIRTPDGRALPSGWINERVNTSDWDDNVGGVFHGSCWCEVALLLTAVELPSIYVDLPARRVWALDHLGASLDGNRLHVNNPTAYPVRARLLIDHRATDLVRTVTLNPGQTVVLPLP